MKSITKTVAYTFLLASTFCSMGSKSAIVDDIAPMPVSHSALAQGVLLGKITLLDPNKPPSGNFDLLDWSLTLPTDLNKDLKADTIYEKPLSNNFELKPLFYI